jgi:hypothetical protein
MSPFWHALSLYVPIYGLFRLYAHFRTINDQLSLRDLPLGIGAGIAVVSIVFGNLLTAVAVGVIVVAFTIANGQRSLNRLWENDFGPSTKRVASAGEWVAVIALGVFIGGAVVIGVASNTNSSNAIRIQMVNCRGWENLNEGMAPISAAMTAFNADIEGTTNPNQRDSRRWAATARQIRQLYLTFDHPPSLNRYVELSVRTMLDYEQGFLALTGGDYGRGQDLLEEGDNVLTQARAAFQYANEQCAS